VTSPKHEPSYDENPETFQGTLYYRISRQKEGNNSSILANLNTVYALFRKIKSIYHYDGFDLIHAHSPSLCGLAALLFTKTTNIPFAYEIRAFWEDAAIDAGKLSLNSWQYRISRFLESILIKRAKAIITIATHLQEDIAKRRGSNSGVFLVPNGVDPQRFHPIPRDRALEEKLHLKPQPVIGFIGSFYRFEGIEVLLTALSVLERQNASYKTILVGDGEMSIEWRTLSRSLGLSNVIFTGRIKHEDVPRYYSAMDVLVYPRNRERITELVTPLKPLEAMAMGKLVIASDVGGLKEILSGGEGGLLFPAGNHLELARLLREVCEHLPSYKHVAENGRKIALRRYSWDKHIHQYVNIYTNVLRSAKRAFPAADPT
jgi:glycogen(starch) synthase